MHKKILLVILSIKIVFHFSTFYLVVNLIIFGMKQTGIWDFGTSIRYDLFFYHLVLAFMFSTKCVCVRHARAYFILMKTVE